MTAGCPHCPDGHGDPARATWGAHVDVFKDGDGQPTIVSVMKTGSQHVADSDADWIAKRLNGSLATTPAEALDALDRLGDELGDRLPGLPAVAAALREMIAEAYLDKAKEESDRKFAADMAAAAKRGSVPPPATGGITLGAVMATMDEARKRDAEMSQAEREALLRAARRRRGIGS